MMLKPFGFNRADTGASPVLSDNFNRADENIEASSLWTLDDGTAGCAGVVSNQLRFKTNTNYRTIGFTTAAPSANYSAEIDYITSTTAGYREVGILICGSGAVGTDADGYIALYNISDNQLGLYRSDAGTLTGLAEMVDTLTGGDTFGVSKTGTTIDLLKNGVSVANVTDATHSGTAVKVYGFLGNAGDTIDLDNFLIS